MGAGDLARTGSREDVCVDLATAPSAVRPNGGAGSIVGIGGVRLTAFAEATVVPNGVRLTAFAEATAVKKPDSTEYVLHSLPHLRFVSELPRPDAAGARDVAPARRGRSSGRKEDPRSTDSAHRRHCHRRRVSRGGRRVHAGAADR